MAEICLECFNKEAAEYNEPQLTEKEVVLANDLCEWCGEIKPCIMRVKEKNIFKAFFYWIVRKVRYYFYIKNQM